VANFAACQTITGNKELGKGFQKPSQYTNMPTRRSAFDTRGYNPWSWS